MKRKGATPGLAQIARGELPMNTLIQFPSGSWGFVGRVTPELAFTAKDGGPADPKQVAIARQFGPGLANVRTRGWATAHEALDAAAAIGAEVTFEVEKTS